MTWAMEDAGVTPEEVDYISAHGTSTKLNDAAETFSIKKAFGEQAYRVPISATKSMIGHAFGAAGALESVACLEAWINATYGVSADRRQARRRGVDKGGAQDRPCLGQRA